jgi:hypothetical protein
MFEQIDFEARALVFVRYYENLATDPKMSKSLERWLPCLDVTNWWLRLLRETNPNPQEIDELIALLASKDLGTAWLELYFMVSAWKGNRVQNP